MNEEEGLASGRSERHAPGQPGEKVMLEVTRGEMWRLRRLNQIINTLRRDRGSGLIWLKCDDEGVQMGIIDLHRIIAEVLERFEK